MAADKEAFVMNDEAFRLHRAGDHEGAIKLLDEAIRLRPNFPAAYRTRADAYRALGRTEEAEADSLRALSITNRTEEADSARARSIIEQRKGRWRAVRRNLVPGAFALLFLYSASDIQFFDSDFSPPPIWDGSSSSLSFRLGGPGTCLQAIWVGPVGC